MTFEESLIQAQDAVRRFVRSRVWDRDLQEDIVQDTMVKALRYRNQFQEGTNLEAWLCTIARNIYYSLLRKRRREVLPGDDKVTQAIDKMQEVENWEPIEVLSALAALSPDKRDALVAVGYLGLTYAEAATALGATAGTVKSRVSRGRDDLAVLVEDGVEVDPSVLDELGQVRAGVPRSHPFYPVADAYAALYGPLLTGVGDTPDEEEKAWRAIVASGAMDYEMEDIG